MGTIKCANTIDDDDSSSYRYLTVKLQLLLKYGMYEMMYTLNIHIYNGDGILESETASTVQTSSASSLFSMCWRTFTLTMYVIQWIVQLDILVRSEARDRWTEGQIVTQIQTWIYHVSHHYLVYCNHKYKVTVIQYSS